MTVYVESGEGVFNDKGPSKSDGFSELLHLTNSDDEQHVGEILRTLMTLPPYEFKLPVCLHPHPKLIHLYHDTEAGSLLIA